MRAAISRGRSADATAVGKAIGGHGASVLIPIHRSVTTGPKNRNPVITSIFVREIHKFCIVASLFHIGFSNRTAFLY